MVITLNDVLVSVRMPESLLSKLKELAEKNHYMDVSEEVRSIIRKNWFELLHPELLEIRKLKESIFGEVKKKSQREIKSKIVKELDDIRRKVSEGK